MKKLFTLLALAFCLNGKAQTWVVLPDTNFANYLQSWFPGIMQGDSLDITNSLVTTTHAMVVHSYNIKNLTGIQYFTSLTYLDCDGNFLSSFPPLPTTLTHLRCSNNFFKTLPALPGNLNFLDCSSDSLTTLPMLPNSLDTLICTDNNNQLTSLPILPNSLKVLECQWNGYLTTLPTLPDSLQELVCYGNNITCFPTFPSSITGIDISLNAFGCLPNHIPAMDANTLLTPLCGVGNTNGCPVPTICNYSVNFSLSQSSTPHVWNAYPIYPSNVSSVIWYWGDGYSSDSLYPNHNYSTAGLYNICITVNDSNGCQTSYCQNDSLYRTSSIIQINVINNITGISKYSSLNTNTSIYPNPNNGSFIIEPSSATKQTMQVYDINGKMVLSQTINGKTNIDAGSLTEGVYNISLISNEGVVNKRVVIVH